MTKKGGEKKKCKSRAKRGREKKEREKRKKKSSPQNRNRVPLMTTGHVLIWADKLAYCMEFDRV